FLLASGMGREFLPSLDEGDVTIHALRIPGTSLTQAIGMQHLLEEKLKELPEVEEVFAKIGTADIATDPMPPSVADVYVMLKPRKLWSASGMTKADIVRKIEEKLKDAPGNRYEFTQPIQMRFNELIAGIRSDVAVKLFGDDMETLAGVGHEIEEALADIRGASDVKMEQTTGLPFLNIVIDRNEAARYGLNVYDVQEIIEIAIGGKSAGEVFEGDRRFEIIVRLSDEARENLEVLKKIPIALPVNGGELKNPKQFGYIPLGTVAEFVQMIGPNQISRENGKRVVIVTSNVRGRDIGSFVEEAEEAIKDKVAVPAGYWTDWGGQFEQMVSAANRLKVVIPLALLLIFLLLFTLFGSVGEALLVFSGVPFALTGGVLSLWLRGIPLSISAGVGFIALSGVAR
ncbi:MAG: efflux RND transporter permease subunit, partial [Deltaproteobacteria bacterium]|nr:efflux RND transporter permease subunit [Deltaproteobacteria bacterium]